MKNGNSKGKQKIIPVAYIRSLLVAQDGKCAITGTKLNPNDVNADHIIPGSRSELRPLFDESNIWLVHKYINSMKCTMTYDELIEACHLILKHEQETRVLLYRIQSRKISLISKAEFEAWAAQN